MKPIWMVAAMVLWAASGWGQRISDGIARNSRNSFGFSLGVLGYYDNNLLGTIDQREPDSAAVFSPGLFFNFGGQRTQFHADYQFAFRRYAKYDELNAQNHEATIELTRKLSRRTSVSFADHFRSGPNDIMSVTRGGSFQMVTNPEQGLQVFFDQQRLISNYLTAGYSAQASRKHRLDFSASSEMYRYRSTNREDTDTIQARISDEYRLTRKISLSGEVSNDWVHSSNHMREGRILRILGGPKYRFTTNWEVMARAGAEIVYQQGADKTGGTYEASLSRNTDFSKFEMRYTRRVGVQLGLSGLNQTDMGRLSFDRRLAPWVSAHLYSTYYHITEIPQYGEIESVGGSGGFEFLIRPYLIANMSGHYLHQTQRNPGLQRFDVDRYILFAGLQYIFPSDNGMRRP